MSVAKEILDRIPPNPVQITTVTCAVTSPFAVYIAGDTVAVPAVMIDTFVPPWGLGDQGYALWQPPLPPICFKTA